MKTRIIKPFLLGMLALAFAFQNVKAEGSKDLFTPSTLGYRQYLNVSDAQAAFNPYPNTGIHKVYVNAGEVIYAGSSLVGSAQSGETASVSIISPTGTVVATSNSVSTGRILNRTQELNGPQRPGLTGTDYYTPLSYTATESGIYEVQFTGVGGTGNGTNIPDGTPTDQYRPLANATSWEQPVHNSSYGLIAAWDVSVGVSPINGTLIPGRLYSTCLNLVGPNNRFLEESFYGKVYVLTSEGFIYQVDNNGLNGASFNFFSSNKGMVTTSGDFSSPASYKSANTTTISTLENLIWDPRTADNAENVTNKIFYNNPALDLPDSASVRIGASNTSTWLYQEPTIPTATASFVDCDNNVTFTSNVAGRYTVFIDANNNGDYEDAGDVVLYGDVAVGINTVAWDGKDADGNNILASSINVLIRLTVAEVHFPFLDVESNLNGIIIKRLDPATRVPLSTYDIVFWNDNDITHSDPDATAGAPSPLSTAVNGVSSSINGHIWTGAAPESSDVNFFGNNKTLDTWTYTYQQDEIVVPFGSCLTISGSVWHDPNTNNIEDAGEAGISGTTSDGTGTITTGEQLYVYLVNADGTVIGKTTVGTDGNYSLDGVPRNTSGLQLVLSAADVPVGSTMTAADLPAGWESTGENVDPSNTAAQGTIGDGIINLETIASGIINQNFGIQQPPTATDNSLPATENPGGTVSQPIPTGSFITADNNGGVVDSIHIPSFPTNVTSITVGTTTYYPTAGDIPGVCPTATCAVFPVEGVTLEVDASGNPVETVSVDPLDGTVTVEIPYVAIDNGNATSDPSDPAILSIPFNEPTYTVSGSIFNDVNGLSDDLVNNSGDVVLPSETMYAYLIDDMGIVVGKQAISMSGSYSFTGVTQGDYTVVITTTNVNVGDPEPSVAMPMGWGLVGEQIGTTAGVGVDPTTNGKQSVSVSSNIDNVNFGIQEPPTAMDNTLPATENPGGTVSQPIPTGSFITADNNGGEVDSIQIPSFPTNVTSITVGTTTYYPTAGDIPGVCPTATCAVFPVEGVTLEVDASGNPVETVSVDPLDGTVTVEIPYVAIDNGNATSDLSDPATLTIPFNVPTLVSLLQFDATAQKGAALLTWITASEENNKGFNVLHSLDGKEWSDIAFVPTQAIDGNSKTQLSYSYLDQKANIGLNYYRLLQTDVDGKYSYSVIRQVSIAQGAQVSIHPNPTTSLVNIGGLNGNEIVVVYDLQGKKMLEIKATSQNISLDFSSFASGVYTIQIVQNNKIVSEKVMKK